jgi:hypothetical protein
MNTTNTFQSLDGKFKSITTELMLDDDKRLDLVTRRNSYGKLTTYATVAQRMKGHSVAFMFGHSMGKDFNRMLACNDVKRITSKAIVEQHQKFLDNIDDIAKDALKYYKVTMVEMAT